MIQKIKQNLLKTVATLSVFGFLAMPVLATQTGFAQSVDTTPTLQGSLCTGAKDLKFGPGSDCTQDASSDGLNKLIAQVINIFSIIVGVVAVIMIIYGGFRYITSGGDSGKVGDAKNTILYAIIGLIVVALAQFIVKFVLEKSINVGTP